jgi:hypothetical protein
MRRFRFSIASLLGIVAFVGVAFAALRDPTGAWDATLLGLTLLVLLASCLLAVHRGGDRRAFWLGFVLFGWAYLVTSLVPPVESRLPTSKALVASWESLARPEILWEDDLTLTGVRSLDVTTPATTARTVPSQPIKWDVTVFHQPAQPPTSYIKRLVFLPGETTGTFVRIGHSILTLVLATLGGLSSRSLRSRSGRSDRVTT